jgi:hypothetical protein
MVMVTQNRCLILMVLVTFTMVTGCSVFISTPRVARYQMQGLDNQFKEFVVPLDHPCEGNMDIELSDRYAVQFDFEWLWSGEAGTSGAAMTDEAYTAPSLVPWMLCKYRF